LGAGDDQAHARAQARHGAQQFHRIHAAQRQVDDGDVDLGAESSLQGAQRHRGVRHLGDTADAELRQRAGQRAALDRIRFRHQEMQMRDVHQYSTRYHPEE
jgi:hypothetical protein